MVRALNPRDSGVNAQNVFVAHAEVGFRTRRDRMRDRSPVFACVNGAEKSGKVVAYGLRMAGVLSVMY